MQWIIIKNLAHTCHRMIWLMRVAFDFTTKTSHFDLKNLKSLSNNSFMSPCKLCKILFFKSHNFAFLVSWINIRICIDSVGFFRGLSVSFSGDAESIMKSRIGFIGLKVADLFEDVVGVCNIEKGTGEVTIYLFIYLFIYFILFLLLITLI